MNHLFSVLITAILCATASAQTIKTLGYNSTNGQVVANTGTNVLTFTNATTKFTTATFASGTNTLNFGADWAITEEGAPVIDNSQGIRFYRAFTFSTNAVAGETRTNLSLGLPALTNTSNVIIMRALSGSTNTNHPYSGSISVTGTNNTNTLVFSNGILQSVQ